MALSLLSRVASKIWDTTRNAITQTGRDLGSNFQAIGQQIGNARQNVASTPMTVQGQPTTVGQRAQQTWNQVRRNPNMLNPISSQAFNNLEQNLPVFNALNPLGDRAWQNVRQTLPSIANNPVVSGARDFTNNWISQPFYDAPTNINTAVNPDSGAGVGGRALAGLQAVGGLIPVDPLDAVVPFVNANLNRGAGGSYVQGLLGNEFSGPGDVIANRGGGETARAIGNAAYLPAMVAVGGLKGKNADNLLKTVLEADEAAKSAKTVNLLSDSVGRTKELPKELPAAPRPTSSLFGGKNAQNAVDLDTQAAVRREAAQARAVSALDELPAYAKELEDEIAQIDDLIVKHPLLSQMDPTLPSPTQLKLMKRAKQVELREAQKTIQSAIDSVPSGGNTTRFIAGEDGTIAPLKKTPSNTAQIDAAIARGEGVNQPVPPRTAGQNALPAPRETPALPAPSETVDIRGLRRAVKEGSNLDYISGVTVKNADEAREAIRAGVPAAKVEMSPTKSTQKTWFDGEGGLRNTADDPFVGKVYPDEVAKMKDVGWYKKIISPRVARLQRILPDRLFKDLKTKVIDELNADLGAGVDWKNGYRQRAKNLGIQAGSKEDTLIRQFVKGDLSEEALRVNHGAATADKVVNASNEMRKMYEEIFPAMNARRAAAGLPEVAYKKDFLSQMDELGGRSDGTTIDFLSSGTTAPKSESLFKHQKAPARTGAIESFEPYLNVAEQAMFVDPHVKTLTQWTDELEAVAKQQGGDPAVVEYLRDYARTLSGERKVGGFERWFEKWVGRPQRTAAVVGNPSSVLNQLLNLPQAVMEAGPVNFIKSIGSKAADDAASSSAYLKTLKNTPPSELIPKGRGRHVVKGMGNILQEANYQTAKTSWRAFYEQGKKAGVKNLSQYADDMTVQVMGDRRLGATSSFYNSPIGRIMGAFTIENQAAINRLATSIGEKKTGTVIGTILLWHAGNAVSERYGTGQRFYLDPIKASEEIYEYAVGSENKDPNTIKAIGRFIGEATKASPATQSMFYTAVKALEFAGNQIAGEDTFDTRDLFGTDDPTWMNVGSLYDPLSRSGRDITGNAWVDEPLNIASNFVPGLNPVLRGVQAGVSNERGYAQSRNENPLYSMPENPYDIGRSILFGQSSTPQAIEYYNNERNRPLDKNQKAVLENLPKDQRADFIASVQSQNQAKNKGGTPATGEQSWWNKITGNGSKFNWDTRPASKAEKTIYDRNVDAALMGGAEVPDSALRQRFFDGIDVKTASKEDVKKVYTGILKAYEDEYYTDEQKQAILKASGVEPLDFAYYQAASTDQEERTAGIIEMAQHDYESREELIINLALGKRSVAGKSMFSTGMYDRLYDEGLISKDEKALLNAVKWDGVYNRFYMDRDYKGGSGSNAKAIAKSINDMQKLILESFNKSRPEVELPELPRDNLTLRTQSSRTLSSPRSTNQWFTPW